VRLPARDMVSLRPLRLFPDRKFRSRLKPSEKGAFALGSAPSTPLFGKSQQITQTVASASAMPPQVDSGDVPRVRMLRVILERQFWECLLQILRQVSHAPHFGGPMFDHENGRAELDVSLPILPIGFSIVVRNEDVGAKTGKSPNPGAGGPSDK